MKEWIIIIVVLVLVFVPGLLFANFLENSGTELLEILADMLRDFDYNREIDFSKSDKLNELFLKNESKWIMIVDHEALDEIEDSVHECDEYYKNGDKENFKTTFKKLKDHIEDLKKREEISFANIL